jgi:predicted ArsR family transcriptional regulator
MNNAERAAQLLEQEPLTRSELEQRLGTSQQRVSEILRKVGAHVVGYVQPPKQGRPAPLYSLEPQEASREWKFGRVSSVFDLGSRA